MVHVQYGGPFETKYESMKKSLLIFTEMGAISDGLATFIDYIAEHVSPRIAGRWDVQGAWCNRYRVESQIKHILLRRCAGVAKSICESLLVSSTICGTT